MARTELTAEQLEEFNSYFRDLQAEAKREGYEVDRDTELQIFIERIAFEAA